MMDLDQYYYQTLRPRRVVLRNGVFLVKRPGMISGGYDHYGVLISGLALKKLGFDPRFPVVIHKTNEGIVPEWVDYSAGWTYVSATQSVDAAIDRLSNSLFDPSFHLIFKNCEHFARFVVEGIAESTQIQNLVGLGGIGLAIYLVSSQGKD